MAPEETATTVEIRCAQCGRVLAGGDVQAWRPGDVVTDEDVDETAAMTILCPECIASEHAGEFDAGQGD